MTRREALRMALTGNKVPYWDAEGADERAARCVAFLLVYGVLNHVDASELFGRVATNVPIVEPGEPDRVTTSSRRATREP